MSTSSVYSGSPPSGWEPPSCNLCGKPSRRGPGRPCFTCEPPKEPLTVGDAFGDRVIEFHFGDDWYQLRRLLSGQMYQYRWRVDTYRGDGWGPWRNVSVVNVRGWSDLPCKRVPITEAEHDPLTRWSP